MHPEEFVLWVDRSPLPLDIVRQIVIASLLVGFRWTSGAIF